MPEMPSADLFDRYAIRNGEIVLHAGFEKLLEAKTGMHAVAQWTAIQSPAPAVDAPAPEEHKSVAASIAATITEPQPVPAQPAAQSPERVRKTFRRVDTTRRPAPAQPMAPRLPRPPELRLVPPQAVQLEAPAIDDAPAPPAPPAQARTRKAAGSPAYWFGAGALAIAVLTSAWFAYAPAPAPADAPVARRPVTKASVPRQEQPLVTAIKNETLTVTIEPAKAGPAPRVAQPASQGNTRVHVVVRGDTLSAIARTYLGDGLRYRELAQLSRIDNPHRIYPGDIVRIEVREKP
jgi:nucleoid-associated protein YgaU